MSIFNNKNKVEQITLFGIEQILINQSIYDRKPNMFEFCPKYQNQYILHYTKHERNRSDVLLTLTISLCLENGVYSFDKPTECDYMVIDILGDSISKRYIQLRENEIDFIEKSINSYLDDKIKFYQDLKDKINAP